MLPAFWQAQAYIHIHPLRLHEKRRIVKADESGVAVGGLTAGQENDASIAGHRKRSGEFACDVLI